MSTQAHPTNPDLAAVASGQSPGDPAALAAEVLSLRAERRATRDEVSRLNARVLDLEFRLARLRRAIWAALDRIDLARKDPDKVGKERGISRGLDALQDAAGERL